MSIRERDFFKERLNEGELRALLADRAPGEAFAWRSPRAKALKLDPANPPSGEELIRLMLDVPHLIRRPLVRVAGETLFGFDQRRLEALLTKG